MSNQLFTYLCIGFRVEWETIDKVFGQKISEIYHMEDRFSEKTGKKVQPVKIVDQREGMIYKIGKKEFSEDYVYEMMQELNRVFNTKLGSKNKIIVFNGIEYAYFCPYPDFVDCVALGDLNSKEMKKRFSELKKLLIKYKLLTTKDQATIEIVEEWA